MKWLNAMLGGHPVIFDDVCFIPQYIVMCQIFFSIYCGGRKRNQDPEWSRWRVHFGRVWEYNTESIGVQESLQ